MKTGRKIKRNLPARSKRLPGADQFRFVALVVAPVVAIAWVGYLFVASVSSSFAVHRIAFTGNEHLGDDELRALAGLRMGENLLTLSSAKIYSKMMASPWLRSVAIRKELPDCLHILMREAEPFALLDMKGKLFIVDEKGRMLEELKDGEVPFLPVITGDPFAGKEAFYEGIDLVRAIKSTGFRKDHIEIIARDPEEMAMNADGTVIKMGAGEYTAKLGRLTELEDEIRKRQIPVDYIDLRFSNKVIVKPVNEVVR